MGLSEIAYCRSIPDDDPLFKGVPAGSTLEVDGVLYIRRRDWLPFLEALSTASKPSSERGMPGDLSSSGA